MSNIPTFGEHEAKKALLILGFEIYEDRGKGGHKLAKHPSRKPNIPRQYPFITIPSWKEYADKGFRKDFIKEIMCFGFEEQEVIMALKGKKIKKKIKPQE